MPILSQQHWKEIVTQLAANASCSSVTNEDELLDIEQEFDLQLPRELRELSLECGAITDKYGSMALWPALEILERNDEFRSLESFKELYMPFNHLLFFGDDGNGDQFAFSIHADGQIHKSDIYLWDHETDSRTWFASGLKQYLEKRLAPHGGTA